jgi:hypothetical protein
MDLSIFGVLLMDLFIFGVHLMDLSILFCSPLNSDGIIASGDGLFVTSDHRQRA